MVPFLHQVIMLSHRDSLAFIDQFAASTLYCDILSFMCHLCVERRKLHLASLWQGCELVILTHERV